MGPRFGQWLVAACGTSTKVAHYLVATQEEKAATLLDEKDLAKYLREEYDQAVLVAGQRKGIVKQIQALKGKHGSTCLRRLTPLRSRIWPRFEATQWCMPHFRPCVLCSVYMESVLRAICDCYRVSCVGCRVQCALDHACAVWRVSMVCGAQCAVLCCVCVMRCVVPAGSHTFQQPWRAPSRFRAVVRIDVSSEQNSRKGS